LRITNAKHSQRSTATILAGFHHLVPHFASTPQESTCFTIGWCIVAHAAHLLIGIVFQVTCAVVVLYLAQKLTVVPIAIALLFVHWNSMSGHRIAFGRLTFYSARSLIAFAMRRVGDVASADRHICWRDATTRSRRSTTIRHPARLSCANSVVRGEYKRTPGYKRVILPCLSCRSRLTRCGLRQQHRRDLSPHQTHAAPPPLVAGYRYFLSFFLYAKQIVGKRNFHCLYLDPPNLYWSSR
jgi:hypothetical protein